ncbi:MAG: CDP-alcohol phosphatidyltransferase family protein [Halobacteriales archaeon]
MTLDRLRPLAMRLLVPFVIAAMRLNLTPNAVSIIAFGLAGLAGIAFYVGGHWYLVGALLVLLSGWLDLLDGALARELEIDSDAGDLLDHVLDRYADIVLLAGLAAGIDAYALGFAAVTGVVMTSYLGTQAQAVGVGRVYAGLLGRADRLAVIGVAAVIAPFVPPLGPLSVIAWLLIALAIVGHLTAIQRFAGAWEELQ